MEASCRPQIYRYEGKDYSEDELIEKYAASGVTVAIFRRRVWSLHWDIQRALTTPLVSAANKPVYTYGQDNKRIKVMFLQHIGGVYAHMQPLLNKVYDAKLVRNINSTPKSSTQKIEFVIITLENGKSLIAYEGEYIEVEN